MSEAGTILARCKAAGLRVERDGDSLLIRPAKRLTPELLNEIRAYKPELLALITEHRPLAEIVPLADEDARLLCDRVIREGPPARAWCMEQSTRYWERYQADHLDCDAAAAFDYLLKQWRGKLNSPDREGQLNEIVAKLRMVEEDFRAYSHAMAVRN